MGNKTNKRRLEQLGMSYGKASHRLRRILMFDMMCRLKENICYSCNQEITNIDDWSIEHKESWLDKSTELFWNLDNIAYSHKWCNTPSKYPGGNGGRRIGPEGTAWCSKCQAFLPIEQFRKKARRWNGVNTYCRICASLLQSISRSKPKI
jgi:hypothetical protein